MGPLLQVLLFDLNSASQSKFIWNPVKYFARKSANTLERSEGERDIETENSAETCRAWKLNFQKPP